MLIVFDVGNTETTIGLFDGERLVAHWRIMTAVARTADEFGLLLVTAPAGGHGPDLTPGGPVWIGWDPDAPVVVRESR